MGRLTVRPNGDRVRYFRAQKGWSQQELAKRSGYGRSTIQWIERGKPTQLETLRNVAEALDTSETDLMFPEDVETPRIRWFVTRESALPDMHLELPRHSRLIFVGVSQRGLQDYLHRHISCHCDEKLPWESIEVYFANDQIGAIYEGDSFLQHLKEHRHKIVGELTSAACARRAPRLKEIKLLQYQGFLGYGGAMLGKAGEEEASIIYVVQSLPKRQGENKIALTFKIEATTHDERTNIDQSLLDHYQEGYQILREQARGLGSFSRSLWDESADEWSAYCRECKAVRQSMLFLVQFGEFSGNEMILDVAAGSGETSQLLFEAIPKGNLVLLDASCQMLQKARALFVGHEQVRFALCSVPHRDRENIDLEGEQFTRVVIHQSIAALAGNVAELNQLADWCYRHTARDGRVVLAVHNGAVHVPCPPEFKNWRDPFREELLRLARADQDLRKHLRHLARPRFKQHDITQAFERAGFCQKNVCIETFQITMRDRRLIWMVPALLDSFIDVRAAGWEKAADLVQRASDSVIDQETMSRIVAYWSFEKAT